MTEQTDAAEAMLTLDEINDLTGDDVAYWLENPFLGRDMIAEKVRFWVTTALAAREAAARAEERERVATAIEAEYATRTHPGDTALSVGLTIAARIARTDGAGS